MCVCAVVNAFGCPGKGEKRERETHTRKKYDAKGKLPVCTSSRTEPHSAIISWQNVKKVFYATFDHRRAKIQLNVICLSQWSLCLLSGRVCDAVAVNRIILSLIAPERHITIYGKKQQTTLSHSLDWMQYFIILKPWRWYTNHVAIIISQTWDWKACKRHTHSLTHSEQQKKSSAHKAPNDKSEQEKLKQWSEKR